MSSLTAGSIMTSTPMDAVLPKLRQPIEMLPSSKGDIPGVVLRDPLGLTDLSLFVPQPLAPLLTLCDGTRDIPALRTALMVRTGTYVGDNAVQDLVDHLDKAFMLENRRFANAQTRVRNEFRSASCRLPTMVGSSYPESPGELAAALEGRLSAVKTAKASHIRGLVSPHIDYPRGFPVYAGVWQAAREAVKQAEIAIIFGTDHNAFHPHLTFTRQSYATPLGLLPTAQDVVFEMERALGPDVFTDELHHRREHSVEAAAVWFHHLNGDRHTVVVPILCGPMFGFLQDGCTPGQDAAISRAVEALRSAIGKRKALVIAAADLAHFGPAFGDLQAADIAECARHEAKDRSLMDSICAGDAEGFFKQVKDEGDRRHVCGLSPIYWALRLLGPSKGTVTGYAQCPADQKGTSKVSICGVVLA